MPKDLVILKFGHKHFIYFYFSDGPFTQSFIWMWLWKPQSVLNFWVTGCHRIQIKVNISVLGWDCPSPALFPWLLCCFKKWKIEFYKHKQGFFFQQSQHFPSITLASVKTYAPAVSWILNLIIMKGCVRYCIPTVTNVGTMNTKWNLHRKQKDYKFENFSHARKLKLKMTP